jgi:hypothetical protein
MYETKLDTSALPWSAGSSRGCVLLTTYNGPPDFVPVG